MKMRYKIGVTLRKTALTFPQSLPISSSTIEKRMSLEGMRAYAMRLLLLIIHMNTSGMLCWGFEENKQIR